MTDNTTRYFSTTRDFIHYYLTDALNGVEENFDYEAFTDALIDAGLLVWDGTHYGIDDDPQSDHQEFWALVAKFDAAALTAAPITAQLVSINRESVGDDGRPEFRDTIRIHGGGYDTAVDVESSEDPAPYDAAVRSVIGDAPFGWVEDQF